MTALGVPLSLIPLLADLFNHFGHHTENFVGIPVGIFRPDLLDNLPESLPGFISLGIGKLGRLYLA